jgi:CHAT domain-containing protein
VVGFQLAFLFAGADSVVLTQWEVPSAIDAEGGEKVYPTSEVIVGFYRDLKRAGMTRSEALRRAQLKVMKRSDRFADPFYWGAWQLYGAP